MNRADIMLFNLDNAIIKEYIKQAEFGIERESLRINADGTLAQTPHPFEEHKNIDRDFCENQVEIIGDVFNDPQNHKAIFFIVKIFYNFRYMEQKILC